MHFFNRETSSICELISIERGFLPKALLQDNAPEAKIHPRHAKSPEDKEPEQSKHRVHSCGPTLFYISNDDS